MRKRSLQEKSRLWFEKNQTVIHSILLSLVGIAFLVSDWVISLFSFGELILIPLLPIFFLITLKMFKWQHGKWMAGVSILLISHLVLQQYFNPEFLIRPAVAAFIKILFYSLFIVSFFNYIKKFKLQKQLLVILNIIGIISIVIGIYIYSAILSEQLPFEFLWTFTRVDVQSYFFRDTRYLVRMRSLFSEPAHFGFFLNTILGINLLQSTRIKIPMFLNGLWVVGILFTFSFSSIFIMLAIIVLYSLKLLFTHKNNIKFNYLQGILITLIIVVIAYLSWDFIEVAILQRAQDIFAGEDNSAIERIIGTWQYVNKNSIWLGNGIGNTPIIWNNYAYFLSDGGLIALFISLIGTFYIMYKNFGLGLLFVLMNFQRGGYLSPTFSLLLVLIILYASRGKTRNTDLIQ